MTHMSTTVQKKNQAPIRHRWAHRAELFLNYQYRRHGWEELFRTSNTAGDTIWNYYGSCFDENSRSSLVLLTPFSEKQIYKDGARTRLFPDLHCCMTLVVVLQSQGTMAR